MAAKSISLVINNHINETKRIIDLPQIQLAIEEAYGRKDQFLYRTVVEILADEGREGAQKIFKRDQKLKNATRKLLSQSFYAQFPSVERSKLYKDVSEEKKQVIRKTIIALEDLAHKNEIHKCLLSAILTKDQTSSLKCLDNLTYSP